MRFLALVLVVAFTAPGAAAQLRLPLLLGDGAVLQRDRPVPVWGWAAPGASVSVRLGEARASATAGADGRWRTELPAMPAGGPVALTVTSGGETARAADLLVGDVYVLSGQSNMEWPVKNARDGAAEVAATDDPRIREFAVPHSFAEVPKDTLAGGAWAPADPQHVGDFSAVGFFFARDLRRHVDVPVGLIHSSWGGSRIEAWISPEMLGFAPGDTSAVFEVARAEQRRVEERVRATLGGPLPTVDGGMVDGVAVWAAPGLDDRDWAAIHVPAPWESQGYDGLDGVAWYRRTFTLTAAEAAQGVTLGLGQIDDSDVSWVGGVEVGHTDNAWTEARVYPVPAEALHEGENVVAVRVEDVQGGGGIAGLDSLLFVQTADGSRRSLAGEWRFRVAAVRFGAVVNQNKVPMGLWNQMIHPLTQAPVAGVLWYQGESNGDTVVDAERYGEQFRSMIAGWRAAWGQPELPFLWVQLAGFHAPPAGPADIGIWPLVRQGQSSALALPRTAEALALDVGDADDIHPRDRQTVGHRLALAARRLIYGETDLVASGPRLQSARADGPRVVVSFESVGGGLQARGGAPLGGFTIAGADGQWHRAEARLEGERVVVSGPDVAVPAMVRYAWADNPVEATLVNAEGLPAAPFQADVRP